MFARLQTRIWTITASVSGNQARQVPAKPGVLDIRTVIRALVLIRVQSSATFCSAHARGVSVHQARRFAGSDGAEAPRYVNSRALHRRRALHLHLHHRRDGQCWQQEWRWQPLYPEPGSAPAPHTQQKEDVLSNHGKQRKVKPDVAWGKKNIYFFCHPGGPCCAEPQQSPLSHGFAVGYQCVGP